MRSGFTRTEVAAALSISAVLGSVGVTLALADPSGRTERLIESLSNLRAIGAANAAYRADNTGYLPLEMTTSTRRPQRGNFGAGAWCTWNWGGKNCSSWWAVDSGRSIFDVEAADRPLNAYLYPGYTFTAPTPPARLPANDPARLNQQARAFRDPADTVGRQRQWPNRNSPAISCYDDIGSSYVAQTAWWDQIDRRFPALSFVGKFNLGTSRLATDQGVDPARFVHFFDEIGDVVLFNPNPQFRTAGNLGGDNAGVSAFADGHATLVTFRPGPDRAAKINETYSVWFEDLGRPAAPGLHDAAPPPAEPK